MKKLLTLFLLLFSLTFLGFATTYYISPTGNDSNDGLGTGDDHAWLTITKANETLTAGDTVEILAGTYDEAIQPDNSGSDGSLITYTRYDTDAVVIDRNDSGNGVYLSGKSYITVSNITIQNCERWVVMLANSTHNIIDTVMMYNAGSWGGVRIQNSNYNTVKDCHIENGLGDVVEIYPASYTLFQDNTVIGGALNTHGGVSLRSVDSENYAEYNVIKGNTIYDPLDDNLTIVQYTRYNLIEDNIVYGAATGAGIKLCGGHYNVVRRNRGYDNKIGILLYTNLHSGVTSSGTYNHIYHNVCYDNSGGGQAGVFYIVYDDAGDLKNNIVKNNILYSNLSYQIYAGVTAGEEAHFGDNTYINNVTYGTAGGQNTVRYLGTTYTTAGANALAPFTANMDSNPTFTDEDGNDFTIPGSSPCVGAGAWLTTITSASDTGTEFVVDDARYFSDGEGLVAGDEIQIEGTADPVGITEIDYDTDTITVDEAVTWTQGDGVGLEFEGSNPDIGWYEYVPLGGNGDQDDWPNIYIDESVAPGGDGSQADPYSDFSEINWTTGGDNSVYDYYNNTPVTSVTLNLKRGEEWRETLTVGCSGTETYPLLVKAYGTGADPIINGSDLVATWTEADVVEDNALSTDSTGVVGDAWYRLIVPAATFTHGGNQIRVQLRSHSTTGSVVTGCSVGERSGSTEDYASAPTRITFDSNNNVTLSADEDKWSDWIDYDWDIANSHLVHVNLDDVGGTVYRKIRDDILGGCYFKNNEGDQTMTEDATAGGSNTYCYTVNQIEIRVNNGWKATCTTEPNSIWLDGIAGNIQTVLEDVDSANDWFWVANVLYVYSATDPDDLSGPGVEAGIRDFCIRFSSMDYITIDGIIGTRANENAFSGLSSTGFVIQNCTGTGNSGYTIAIQGAPEDVSSGLIANNICKDSVLHGGIFIGTSPNGPTGITIEHNDIYDNLNHGMYLNYANSNIIRYNKFHSNGQHGLSLQNESDSNQVYYNLLFLNGGKGITLPGTEGGGSSDSNLIYNNLIYNNTDCGFVISAGGDGNIFKNNIIHHDNLTYNRPIYIATAEIADNTFDNNRYYFDSVIVELDGQVAAVDSVGKTLAEWQALEGSPDANSTHGDPHMIDPANGDFRLNPHSLCVNAGTAVGLLVDYLGLMIRHAPDIGAHENQSNAIF